MTYTRLTQKALSISLLWASICSANAAEKPIPVKTPLLPERQYFSYKGQSASLVTLKTLQDFDCHELMDMSDENPALIVLKLELFILIQKALEGIDIATMSFSERENLAQAEVAIKLRRIHRDQEALDYIETRNNKVPKLPSVSSLCQILEDIKMDILHEKYHLKIDWPVPKAK